MDQIAKPASTQIVKDEDGVTLALDETINEMASDETSSARHEDAHNGPRFAVFGAEANWKDVGSLASGKART